MNYLELFTSAITALRGNVLRTLLTMLGIIIGIASVIMIISLAQGATSSITSSISSLGSNLLTVSPGKQIQGPPTQAGTVNTLTYEDAKALTEGAKIENIAAVSAVVQKSFSVTANGQSSANPVYGVSDGYPTIQSIEMTLGDFISEDDVTGLSRVAVLGPDVVTNLFGEGADPVGQNVTIDSRPFRVIGVTKAKGSSGFANPDEAIYIPITTAMKLILGVDHVNQIQISVVNADLIDQTSADVTQVLMDRHNIADSSLADFNIRSSKDTLATLNTVTSTLTLMLGGIAAISLVVGGIGIMNIMLVTVTERTKEIGLLKAIGAKRKDILAQFLIESIVLTLTGGVIGIISGVSLAFIISSLIKVPFVVQYSSILLAVGVSTVVGVVFGLYPAQKAARLNPIDALRYE